MRRIRGASGSRAIAVAVVALVAAVAGTAVAGPQATNSLSKKRTTKVAKRVAKKQIKKRASGLSVANADTVDGQDADAFLPADAVGVPVAGANVAADGTLRRSFNRLGGSPTVTKAGSPDGEYTLRFPGLEGKLGFGESIAVASINGGTFGEILRSSDGAGDLLIDTGNSAGAQMDRSFEVVIFLLSP